MSALAVLAGAGGIWFAWDRGYMRRWWLQLASSTVFVVSGAICLLAVINWYRAIPIKVSIQTSPQRLDHRVASSAVITYHEKGGSPHRPEVGSGVVIHKDDSRVWVITSPPRAADLQDTIWVTFANGDDYQGEIRWHGPDTSNLLLLEAHVGNPLDGGPMVQIAPVAAEMHPWSDAIVPGEVMWMAHNLSLYGGALGQGCVIKRRFVSTSIGDYSLLSTDLEAAPGDIGGGLFDRDGKLIGLLLQAAEKGFWTAIQPLTPKSPPVSPEGGADDVEEGVRLAQVMTLSPDIIRRIIRAGGPRNFTQPQSVLVATNER